MLGTWKSKPRALPRDEFESAKSDKKLVFFDDPEFDGEVIVDPFHAKATGTIVGYGCEGHCALALPLMVLKTHEPSLRLEVEETLSHDISKWSVDKVLFANKPGRPKKRKHSG